MPKPIALDTPCETCGQNEWWDNRATKKSAKMPDFRCANKECKTDSGYPQGRWEKKDKPKPPAEPKGGRLTPDDTTPDERGERVFTWAAMTYTYAKLYAAVYKTVLAHLPPEVPVDQNAVQAGVATLLIQGDRSHIPLLHPRKVTKAEVQKSEPKKVPAHLAEDFERMPDALEGDDDSLPW